MLRIYNLSLVQLAKLSSFRPSDSKPRHKWKSTQKATMTSNRSSALNVKNDSETSPTWMFTWEVTTTSLRTLVNTVTSGLAIPVVYGLVGLNAIQRQTKFCWFLFYLWLFLDPWAHTHKGKAIRVQSLPVQKHQLAKPKQTLITSSLYVLNVYVMNNWWFLNETHFLFSYWSEDKKAAENWWNWRLG